MECHCFAGRGISRPQQHRVMVSPLHLPPISHLLLLHLLHLVLLQPHLHQSPNPSLPPSWSSPTNLLPHCWRECLEWILPLINSKSKVVWITCSLLVLFQIFQTFHCGQAWRWKGPCLLWSFLLSGLFFAVWGNNAERFPACRWGLGRRSRYLQVYTESSGHLCFQTNFRFS